MACKGRRAHPIGPRLHSGRRALVSLPLVLDTYDILIWHTPAELAGDYQPPCAARRRRCAHQLASSANSTLQRVRPKGLRWPPTVLVGNVALSLAPVSTSRIRALTPSASAHTNTPGCPQSWRTHCTWGSKMSLSEMSTGRPVARLSRAWYLVPLLSPASTRTVAAAIRDITRFLAGKCPRRVTVPGPNGDTSR